MKIKYDAPVTELVYFRTADMLCGSDDLADGSGMGDELEELFGTNSSNET